MVLYRKLCASAIYLLFCVDLGANAARIVVFPLPWASRAFDLVKLTAELSRRGHEVMLVTTASINPRVNAMLAREEKSQGQTHRKSHCALVFTRV